MGLAAKYTLEKHYDVRVYDIDGRGSGMMSLDLMQYSFVF